MEFDDMEKTEIDSERKIALLIDGDNAQPSLLENMLIELGKYGSITIRRIFGDWTRQNMNGWKQSLQSHAIQPVQQFAYTTGKNATDSCMIIDAMDILHSDLVNSFCIVSSDSDYTRLATRIREEGFFVIGIGAKKTPKSFVNACNLFIFTENFASKAVKGQTPKKKDVKAKGKEETVASSPLDMLKLAYDMAVGEDDWAELAVLGNYLRQIDPSFDSRTYGHKSLSTLIKSFSSKFILKYLDESGPTTVYVKMRESK